MEEVITEEEQQGEGIMTLFPLLEELKLQRLPKLRHFFVTEHALKFAFLRNVLIVDCPEMKTFVQYGISVSTPCLESVNNDDEVKVDDLNKAMFNSKVSCLSLEKLNISGANSMSALCSHQLPTAYFSKLGELYVRNCGKLRNLMSSSVARGAWNLRKLEITDCESMEEVIKEEEQQGKRIMTLFPLLEKLELYRMPMLRHFFLTDHALVFAFLKNVLIVDCPEMKSFVQLGICVSCPNLERLNINGADIMSALCSHQLPTAYVSKLVKLRVSGCEKLSNLMFSSLARGLNPGILNIGGCQSMEVVITQEEQQGEGITTLFPRLEELELRDLPKLSQFFMTEHDINFPFLKQVTIDDCPQMKTFVQRQVSASCPNLEKRHILGA